MRIDIDPYPAETSPSQRKWIYQRDEYRCQMPIIVLPTKHIVIISCANVGEEVHHILPKRAIRHNGGGDPHTEHNLILLCRYHHYKIHPDIIEALKKRAMGDKYALDRLFRERDLQLSTGQIYWVSTWDRILRATAIKRSEEFYQKYPYCVYPKTKPSGLICAQSS